MSVTGQSYIYIFICNEVFVHQDGLSCTNCRPALPTRLLLCCNIYTLALRLFLNTFAELFVQLCVIHQIRNSMKYVGSKYQKEFMKDLKPVYGAVTKDAGEMTLDKLEEKWGITSQQLAIKFEDRYNLL